MDGLLGIVFQPVSHTDCGKRQGDVDVEIFPDYLDFCHFERNRVAGADAGGITDDRIAIGMQQGRQEHERQQGKEISFHGRNNEIGV